MWQCKRCKEKYLEEQTHHLCVSDDLSKYFHGRKAVLEPLFRSLVQKLEKVGGIKLTEHDSFIQLENINPFALVRVASDHLELMFNLPKEAPLTPDITTLRVKVGNMTYFKTIRSVSDIGPHILRYLMWSMDLSKGKKHA